MPRTPRSDRPVLSDPPPGVTEYQPFRHFECELSGGRAGGTYLSHSVVEHAHTIHLGKHRYPVAVPREGDVHTVTVAYLNEQIDREASIEASRVVAEDLASRWCVQVYEFSHWRKGDSWGSSRVAVWQLVGTSPLVPSESETGRGLWQLAFTMPAGAGEVEVLLPVQPLTACGDRWDGFYRQVEAASTSFATLAAILPPGPVVEQANGAARAVRTTLAEARRLADVGRQLEASGLNLSQEVDRVVARLEGLHSWSVEVVRVLANLHLELPSDGAAPEPSERLQGLVEGLAEVRAITA